MNLSSMRLTGAALIAVAALTACDAGSVVLWPWVEVGSNDANDPNAPPPPPPPLSPTNPLDPSNINPTDAVPNPNANTGAPADGTPFVEKPEDPEVNVGDSAPPVNPETGEPVPELPPPTEEASNAPTPSPSPPEPSDGPSTPATPAPATPSFYFFRAGNLAPNSGAGAQESAVLVPDLQFPIKSAPAVAQTQVYRYGGGVKGGDQCDPRNFSAPWRDNYCETRTTENATPWCAKKGVHLGQDLRVGTPEGCKAEVKTKAADRTRYEVVAVEDGIISNVGSYSVTLRANSGGRIYRYLHLNMAKLKVATNQTVKKGDVIGYVSNDFGGTPTTLHLHFEIKLNTTENGWQYAPPYTSLLAAYQRREGNPGEMVADNFAVATAPH